MSSAPARDSFPDVLRGFALLGIALVNVPYLAIDTVNAADGADLGQSSNAIAAFLVMALFQAKFYLIFSFLFGYSAHYILKDNPANKGRWLARSVGLMILGVLHFTFLFHGDILFVYGVFGLALTYFYFRPDDSVRSWARGIFLSSAIVFALLSLLTLVGEAVSKAEGEELPAETFRSSLDAALESGSFLDTVAPRFELWLFAAPNGFLLQGPFVFAAFLVGIYVARKNGLTDVKPQLMSRLITWGFGLGLPLQILAAALYVLNSTLIDSLGLYLVTLAINFVTAPLLSGAYIALLWRIHQKYRIGLFSAPGRMSLTVYLSESLVFSFLFSAWGLGWFGQLGVAEVSLIAFLVWLGLAALAMLYLRFIPKGPMEQALTAFSKLFSR